MRVHSAVGSIGAIFLAALAFGAPAAFAQNAGAAAGVPVHMIVTVEARRGTEPPTISQPDILVHQGHDRVPVTGWTPIQPGSTPMELYLAIDDSLASTLDARFADLQNFARRQPQGIALGIAYMRNGTVDIVQNPTRDYESAAKSLRMPQGIAGGSPYESLVELIKRWPASAAAREILMVSDGIEPYGPAESSNPYVQNAITAAQRAGIAVFTLYSPAAGHWGHTLWRTNWGLTYLSQLADETGGEGYGLSGLNVVSFTPYLDDLRQRLQHQYELTFMAKPQSKPGLQPVRITTEVPNVDLVAADRVWVPE